MVVGNGMLAAAFSRFKGDESVIIFASGVSNSGEKNDAAFLREKELLQNFSRTPAKLVYFSTISIEDPDLRESLYVQHKIAMERIIEKTCSRYLIFRLPNLVGSSANPYTLTNFIFNRMVKDEAVPVYMNAKRFLMDVEDISGLLSPMIRDEYFINRRENIFIGEGIFIADLVKIFEDVLDKKAQTEQITKGKLYQPDNSFFLNYVRQTGFVAGEDYYKRLIRKYYTK